MAIHVKWLKPKIENDYKVHAQRYDGLTLCGLAHEGGGERNEQDFVVTTKKITCWQCLEIIAFCKAIKDSEYGTKV